MTNKHLCWSNLFNTQTLEGVVELFLRVSMHCLTLMGNTINFRYSDISQYLQTHALGSRKPQKETFLNEIWDVTGM